MDDLAALAALAGCNTEPPDTDVWDDWFGGATPEEVAEVYRARGWAWGTTVRTGRVWLP